MKIRHSITTALKGLRSHKTRSGLTILGIVIGITAIILVMALGKGAQNLILVQIQGLGSKTLVIIPGREPSGPTDPSVIESLQSDSLGERELRELKKKENVPTLSKVMPIVFGTATSEYESETYRLTVLGATPLAEEMYDLEISDGSFFTEEDITARADVVIIGDKIRDELFGARPALNEKIKIKGRNFRVIGIMPKKGQVSFLNLDEVAFVPYTTAQQYIFGIRYYHRVAAEADSEENIDQTVADITATLRALHNIEDSSKDDFFIQTQADLASTVSTVTNVMTLFLVSVAAISLLVGGVGIMNIMLVSVTERTREIGLRKALGAKGSDILSQFLLEAVILTGIGGVIGILLGAFWAFVVSFVLSRVLSLDWAYAFPLTPALIGLVVSASIGLVFGLYPARAASKKSPIEALRYE
ncbi:MAG: hypothetical protein A3E98_03770 [Candidatus Doudnabacteria bacterium RIFCSPHIGHO2_12_FULL_48_11]|uniref:Multidrug ABC transporter substrate-binding protein n=1 Tax=Candidatus Doudnabacteria bacterium RIFCSPHIGHO2_01_FULL_46_24 TaxID=1817825 RepID=A0A1F5NTK8_9BACT|nr:MAG: hypothetical protein A2720_03760 [Candidatus Doudnabacteria bacterium RIFCSPHIGHO2_01_FULL_46_24]OGE95865.1 MAG: hypothetical protein A3E98_03770 [Candidatus Doudnabacteria bacterium RIFCSPHIGHO2_12_FULL_48_11]